MADTKRNVLITGCSDGSLGSALATAVHEHGGFHVFATARETDHMASLQGKGIETLELDATSEPSIQSLVEKISPVTGGTLDMLINTVGGGHYMPFWHLDLAKAKALFDVNVWGFVAVTQAFLPLLKKNASPEPKGHKNIIVNNTSISSVLRTPFHSAYSASKAAMAMFNDIQRIELEPLGIRVVDLKTGSTKSNFQENKTNEYDLPMDSPYQPIKDEIMKVVTGEVTEAYAEDQNEWAKNVVNDLLKDPYSPPAQIWRGGKAGTIKYSSGLDNVIATSASDREFQRLGGLDKLGKLLAEQDR